jgi:hypothetical protein
MITLSVADKFIHLRQINFRKKLSVIGLAPRDKYFFWVHMSKIRKFISLMSPCDF